jgi:phosphonate transport system substrate-binding protein
MADNAEATCRAIGAWLGDALNVETEFVDCVGWEERERMLDAGEIDVCWICGLPYVWKVDAHAPVEICAVPVMRGARYASEPVYFSDVIVRRDGGYRTFAHLRGARWAYNEPRSHSGYNVVRHHLATLGELEGYFGEVVESGAHQSSLRMIVEGAIDASAIDSTVLEAELARNPEYAAHIESIATLGPSPMPPWIVRTDLPLDLRRRIQQALLNMHACADGAAILHSWGMSHFVASSDRDYDSLREMDDAARNVPLSREVAAAYCGATVQVG